MYAAVIPDFPYHAGIHVHYQETVLSIKDGLPKMKDLPKEMGGSASAWRNNTAGSSSFVAQYGAPADQPLAAITASG